MDGDGGDERGSGIEETGDLRWLKFRSVCGERRCGACVGGADRGATREEPKST